MQSLLKVAKEMKVVHLRGAKYDFRDEKGKVVIKAGENGVALYDLESGRMAVLSEAEFKKLENKSMASRIWDSTRGRGMQAFNAVHIKIGKTGVQVGILPISMAATVIGAFIGITEGVFHEIVQKVRSLSKIGSALEKSAGNTYPAYKPPKQAPDSKSLNRGHNAAVVPTTAALAKKSMKKTAMGVMNPPAPPKPKVAPQYKPPSPTSMAIAKPKPAMPTKVAEEQPEKSRFQRAKAFAGKHKGKALLLPLAAPAAGAVAGAGILASKALKKRSKIRNQPSLYRPNRESIKRLMG